MHFYRLLLGFFISGFIIFIFNIHNTEAAEKFMTYPYIDNVKVQQGWIYMDGGTHRGMDYIKGTVDQSATWQAFDVLATSDGDAYYSTNPTWGNYVRLKKTINGVDYYNIYAHLESSPLPVNQTTAVLRGQMIGVSGITGASNGVLHLHFEYSENGYGTAETKKDAYDIRNTRPYYPEYGGNCGTDYAWTTCPPVKYNYTSSSTSWNFNSSVESWSAVNAINYGIDGGSSWKFDPGVDPRLISPQLSAVNASTHKILKIRMDVPGTGSDTGKVYFKNNINDAWTSSKSVSFDINKSNSGQQIYYAQMRDNTNWTGFISQIRIDPVVNYPSDNTGSIYLDSITFESANDANSFLGQGATPSTTVTTGQPFSIWFQIQNNGNTNWTSSYSLKLDSSVNPNYSMGAPNPSYISGTVLPGGSYTFNLNMTAPSTAGTHHTEWKVANASGALFGARLFLDITVIDPPHHNDSTDFNGDGKTDAALFEYLPIDPQQQNSFWIAPSSGSSFTPGGSWLNWGIKDERYGPISGDFNGDGKTDVGLFEYRPYDANLQNTFWIALSNGSSFTANGAWLNWGIKDGRYKAITGDFNGDGKTDVGFFEDQPYNSQQTNTFWVALSTGSSFTPAGAWLSWGIKDGRYRPVVGDFNGDGKIDVGLFEEKPYDSQQTNAFWIALSTGSSFTASGAWLSWGIKDGRYQPIIGDFNGDGKTDVGLFEEKLYNSQQQNTFWIALSNGSSFTANGAWLNWGIKDGRYLPLIGDFNGDGKTDVGLFEYKPFNAQYQNTFWVALSAGSSFTTNGFWLEWGIKDGRYELMSGDH